MISSNKLNELRGDEVYEIFMLRQQVFMLEQQCLYQDIDPSDLHAWHLRATNEKGALAGYLRILPPSGTAEPSIGRVAVSKKARRQGLARELMETALELCAKEYPTQKIRLAAQVYLIDFYSSLGFIPSGPEYLEDDIPHQDMFRPASAAK